MGNLSISQQGDKEKVQQCDDLEWEKDSYQEGCALARRLAIKRLEGIEERLYQNHPASWEVIGFRGRTFVTRFGELRINRRLYRDEKGSYHFLLDEYLGWPPNQIATPDLQECLVKQATQVPFRSVSETLEKLTAGILSASTIHRLVQKTAKVVMEKERADWQALFEEGKLPAGGERKVPILYSEGDGVWVHLQREKQEHYEIKNAIAYEGWERLSGKEERYRLVNKRVYCQADDEISFWEGASLEWSRQWDLSYVRQIVIGGDGADWIDAGIGEFAHSIRQLDGFHLARACGRGWQEGGAIYQAIRAGEVEEASRLINNLISREGKRYQKARQYVERNLEKGRDWRTCKASFHAEGVQNEIEGRGLGTMESNEDKLVANRMKKRGLSWRIGGGCRMAKVIQLAANGEIRPYCIRQQNTVSEKTADALISTPKSRPNGYQKWLQAGIPALTGPHASRLWVENLRRMAHEPHLLN